MPTAIWMISYAIGEPDRPGYAEWFHGVHIPEKLARPGYTAAAHYQSLAGAGRYVALFRAADARAFLAPTPWQLKQGQDGLTKKMIGLRGASLLLFATGRGRHALIEEYDSAAAQPGRFPATATHVPGSPFEGRRISPPA